VHRRVNGLDEHVERLERRSYRVLWHPQPPARQHLHLEEEHLLVVKLRDERATLQERDDRDVGRAADRDRDGGEVARARGGMAELIHPHRQRPAQARGGREHDQTAREHRRAHAARVRRFRHEHPQRHARQQHQQGCGGSSGGGGGHGAGGEARRRR
jgi:hypothetical protein